MIKKINSNWLDRIELRNRKIAKYRAENSSKSRKGLRCSSCGLFGCVCQMTLQDWEIKDLLKGKKWLDGLIKIKELKKKLYR